MLLNIILLVMVRFDAKMDTIHAHDVAGEKEKPLK